MTALAQGARPYLKTELSELGERLIRFGEALRDPGTTVGQLTSLAGSCGIKLHMRAVAESGSTDGQQIGRHATEA